MTDPVESYLSLVVNLQTLVIRMSRLYLYVKTDFPVAILPMSTNLNVIS